MSVRLEWITASHCHVEPMVAGDEAGDGQYVTEPVALAIGPLVVEGTVDELTEMLAQAQRALVEAVASKSAKEIGALLGGKTASEILEGIGEDCEYDEDEDSSVDNLIEYKNALEDQLGSILTALEVRAA